MSEPENPADLDRRQSPRYGLPGCVIIQGTESWSGEYHTANISATGAFLISDSPPPRGTTVRLDLRIDPLCAMENIDGLVVHVRGDASVPEARGCGLMFLRLTEAQRQLLVRLLATTTLPPSPAPPPPVTAPRPRAAKAQSPKGAESPKGAQSPSDSLDEGQGE